MYVADEYGEITVGEINNHSITQFTDSLNDYLNSDDLYEENDILKEFGTFKFGEIGNLLLSDFERALNRFFFIVI
jgi:hypothetical protein